MIRAESGKPQRAQALARSVRRHTAERLAVAVEGHERDDRQRGHRADRGDRRLQVTEIEERLDHEEIDAAALQDAGLLCVQRRRFEVAQLRVAERSDRARDEDLAARDLAGFAREANGRAVDRQELVFEEVLRELRAVRAECVRLDQVRACADVAEMHVDDAVGRAEVRLFGAAQARDGARKQRSHAAVGDDRRTVAQPLEEPAHYHQCREGMEVTEDGERGRRQPCALRTRKLPELPPPHRGPLNGCSVSIERCIDFTYPSYAVDPACSRLKDARMRADTGAGLLPGD